MRSFSSSVSVAGVLALCLAFQSSIASQEPDRPGRPLRPGEIAGVVTDSGGNPLADVLVDVWSWRPGHRTRTDAEGKFRLTGLQRRGKIEILFSKEGWTPHRIMQQPTGGAPLSIALDNRTYIEGLVTDPEGRPAAGVLIRSNPGQKRADGFVVNSLWTETKSDSEGRYRLYVEPDIYDIQARSSAGDVARVQGFMSLPNQAAVLDLSLAPGITFRARFVDSLTGDPVDGVRLSNRSHRDAAGLSDSAGWIEIGDLHGGPMSFNVRVQDRTHVRWWSDMAIKPWERFSLEPPNHPTNPGWQRNFDRLSFDMQPRMGPVTITLEPAVIIEGRVLDPDGNPVAGATVAPALTGSGNSITGDTRFSFRTNEAGEYRMQLPASGGREYNLVAHDGKHGEWREWANGVLEPFATSPGQHLQGVDIRLNRPAIVRGRALDAQGLAIVDARVRAHGADKLGNRYYDPTFRTLADGTFVLRFVRPGKHFIQVEPFWLAAEDAPTPATIILELKPGEEKSGLILIQAPTRKPATPPPDRPPIS